VGIRLIHSNKQVADEAKLAPLNIMKGSCMMIMALDNGPIYSGTGPEPVWDGVGETGGEYSASAPAPSAFGVGGGIAASPNPGSTASYGQATGGGWHAADAGAARAASGGGFGLAGTPSAGAGRPPP